MGLCAFFFFLYNLWEPEHLIFITAATTAAAAALHIAYRGYIVDCTYTHKLYTLDLTCRAMAAVRDISHMRRGATVNSRYAR